ncbi:MAG: ribonuclease HII [Candidatus Lambdaproteobacteria bacterium]|nr:ribonuclease HII [Candidatus Lambdaproteobacteria bacterium]
MPDFRLERELWAQGYRLVAGVDEAGRGPLAGPVVVAAVVLPPEWPPELRLNDSKKLAPAQRERLFPEIRRRAIAWRITAVMPAEIDRVNILRATLAGMARAIASLRPAPDCVLVDGNTLPRLALPARAVVAGDARSNSIAAASILAKVVRDRIMGAYARRYPGWGFERHKGYGTEAHREALARLGASPIHRRSFRVRAPA